VNLSIIKRVSHFDLSQRKPGMGGAFAFENGVDVAGGFIIMTDWHQSAAFYAD
jgi:hypothetical protein